MCVLCVKFSKVIMRLQYEYEFTNDVCQYFLFGPLPKSFLPKLRLASPHQHSPVVRRRASENPGILPTRRHKSCAQNQLSFGSALASAPAVTSNSAVQAYVSTIEEMETWIRCSGVMVANERL